jgi:hypothetical protein
MPLAGTRGRPVAGPEPKFVGYLGPGPTTHCPPDQSNGDRVGNQGAFGRNRVLEGLRERIVSDRAKGATSPCAWRRLPLIRSGFPLHVKENGAGTSI